STDVDCGRHAAACRLRLATPDRLIMWHGGDLPSALREFMVEHGPMQVVDGLECVVPGATVAERLARVMSFVAAQLGWMVMADGDIRLDQLLPLGFGPGVFTNIESSDSFLELLCGAIPFLSEDSFCRIANAEFNES